MPSDALSTERPWRRIAAISGAAGLALTLLLGVLVRFDAIAEDIDGAWMQKIFPLRGPGGETVARLFDFLGGGWFAIFALPIGVAIVFLLVKRPWAALVFVLASAVSAGIVQLLKVLFGRERPDEILLDLDSGSFPSGHTANAATIAALLGVLLVRRWVVAVSALYVLFMALSRTYLGAHWVSDTVGGILLGVSVALAVWAVFAPQLSRERAARRASVAS